MADGSWDGKKGDELQNLVLQLVKDVSSLSDLKADTDLEEAGVDSMDASAIQKKIIKLHPKSGMNEDALLVLESLKTVDAICKHIADA
mmetsp:Transcript_79080/g.256041  ORF Transcript_79080/g.256041 Transcript_79080/m.256041 type:complete len:88 (+) Transcript_79080:100-363(+)